MRHLLTSLPLLAVCLAAKAGTSGSQSPPYLGSAVITAAAPPGGGSNNYSLVFTATGAGNANDANTSATNSSGATLLIAAVTMYAADPRLDDKTNSASTGNVWTPLTIYGTSYRIAIFYCTNPVVGSDHVFTSSLGAAYPCLAVFGFAGNNSAPFDAENGNTASSFTTIATGSASMSGQGLSVSAVSWATSTETGSPDSGYTSLGTIQNSAGALALAPAYKLTSGSQNVTWTVTSSSSAGAAAIATFK